MTKQLNNIGIIGGSGWMGRALLKQLLANKATKGYDVWISNRSGKSPELGNLPHVKVTKDNNELVQHCDTVVLSVRPHQFASLRLSLTKHLVISMMAGVSVQKIKEHTRASQIVRAMPNAAIEIGQSYTPWFATPEVSKQQLDAIAQWFAIFGAADQVKNEDEINFFTALTGSGQGWVAFFEQCLIQCGVNYGLAPELAERAIRQLFLGMGKLLAKEKQSTDDLISMLIDYAGTTAAGLKEMQASMIAKEIARAIEASYQKSMSDMTKDKS